MNRMKILGCSLACVIGLTFLVSAAWAQPIVSVSSATGEPGGTVMVQVNASDLSGAAAGNLVVRYDASALSVEGTQVLEGGTLVGLTPLGLNTNTAGQVKVGFFTVQPPASGGGDLFSIEFRIGANASGVLVVQVEVEDNAFYDVTDKALPTVTTQAGEIRVEADTPPPPEAGFTASETSGDAPLAVRFTDGSSGEITTYAWVFGDGGTSTEPSPVHTYTAAGTYTVTLTVTGPGGSATHTLQIEVTQPAVAPEAGFTASVTSEDAPLAVRFTDGSSGEITTYAWVFGDGGTSAESGPVHTYTAAGTYTVMLTVTGPGGSATHTLQIEVTQPAAAPEAGFTASVTSGDAPLAVSFTDASSGEITSYAWAFGDGGTSADPNPSYTYKAAGTWTASLTVTGPGGSDTQTQTITVDEPEGEEPIDPFSIRHIAPDRLPSIDGDLSDWEQLFGPPQLIQTHFSSSFGELLGPVPLDDQQVEVWLGWNEQTNLIYLGARVRDNAFGTLPEDDFFRNWLSDNIA